MRRLLTAIVLLVVLACGGAVWLLVRSSSPRNMRGSATKEFITTSPPVAPRPHASIATVPWPMYGYDAARSRDAAQFTLRPPFKRIWTLRAWNTIEFPPVVGYGVVFVNQYWGRFFAADATTGRPIWEKHFLHCAAASPVIGHNIVYQAYMQPYPCNRYPRSQRGFVVAMRFRNRHGVLINGRILWRYPSGAIETSPLLVGGTLYWGTWDHRLYALDIRSPRHPRLRWSFLADDEIDSSPAYSNGRVFFGTNGGHVYALDAHTGRQLWRASSFASVLGGRQYFYATPTLAYGRVYIGNTDGTLYAFGQRSGRLLWARHAGTYVYTAAAIWRRYVIIGTYDGHVIAYDAATGDEVWNHSAPAAVHGAPAVIDGVLYFSTCSACGSHGSRFAKSGPRGTYALDAANGRLLWTFPDGEYSPAVADSRRLYVAGRARIYGLVPTSKYRSYAAEVLHRPTR